MKRLIRNYFIVLLALYFTTQIASGFAFAKGPETFLITAGVLTAAMMFGKPIINLLLLPLNLITFGVFRWVSSAVALFLTTLVVKEFKVEYFYYQGFSSKWFDIPELNFKGVVAYIAFAFILSFITSFLHWVRK